MVDSHRRRSARAMTAIKRFWRALSSREVNVLVCDGQAEDVEKYAGFPDLASGAAHAQHRRHLQHHNRARAEMDPMTTPYIPARTSDPVNPDTWQTGQAEFESLTAEVTARGWTIQI